MLLQSTGRLDPSISRTLESSTKLSACEPCRDRLMICTRHAGLVGYAHSVFGRVARIYRFLHVSPCIPLHVYSGLYFHD